MVKFTLLSGISCELQNFGPFELLAHHLIESCRSLCVTTQKREHLSRWLYCLPELALGRPRTRIRQCVSVCVSVFTQGTLCTTTMVYGGLVHHQGAICTTKAQYSSWAPLPGDCQLILVIDAALCQTSCPLRTVHHNSKPSSVHQRPVPKSALERRKSGQVHHGYLYILPDAVSILIFNSDDFFLQWAVAFFFLEKNPKPYTLKKVWSLYWVKFAQGPIQIFPT